MVASSRSPVDLRPDDADVQRPPVAEAERVERLAGRCRDARRRRRCRTRRRTARRARRRPARRARRWPPGWPTPARPSRASTGPSRCRCPAPRRRRRPTRTPARCRPRCPGTGAMWLTKPRIRTGSTLMLFLLTERRWPAAPELGGRDLACRVARQLVDDVDPTRTLVAGQLAAGGLDDRLWGAVGRRVQDDHGDDLAPGRVGHADDDDVGDLRVEAQDLLDLRGIDVLPTGDDQVLQAVGEEEVAVARRGGRRRRSAASRRWSSSAVATGRPW